MKSKEEIDKQWPTAKSVVIWLDHEEVSQWKKGNKDWVSNGIHPALVAVWDFAFPDCVKSESPTVYCIQCGMRKLVVEGTNYCVDCLPHIQSLGLGQVKSN